jgi:AraC family transcriptional regulator
MLRSFERLCHPANTDLLIAADEGHAVVAGGRAYAMPWHWHDCLMLILPSRGTIELRHEDRRGGTWLSQDRFAVVPPNRAHETQAGVGEHSHLAIYVTAGMLDRLEKQIGSLREFRRRTSSIMLARRTVKLRALQELSLRNDGNAYGYSQVRHGLTSALLVQCISEIVAGEVLPNTSHREHGAMLVEDLKAYLSLNPDQDVSLDALGERFGVSRRHITRMFREGTGCSIGEFQQRVRLEAACELLSETDLPIGEIAFRVGFDSGAALAHAMRRADGRSPSEVRRRVARSIKNSGPFRRASKPPTP